MNQLTHVFYITKSKNTFLNGYESSRIGERLFDDYQEGIRESLYDPEETLYKLINIDNKEEIKNLPSSTFLLIEDQPSQVFFITEELKESFLFSNILVCDTRETVYELLDIIPQESIPKIIGLDFSLNFGDLGITEAGLTKDLYLAIKSKWKNSMVVGMSNHESSKTSEIITDEMRKNGDSAYDKYSIQKAISAILKDKLLILEFKNENKQITQMNTNLANQLTKIQDIPKDKLLAEETYLTVLDYICRRLVSKNINTVSDGELSKYFPSIEKSVPKEIQQKFTDNEFTFAKFGHHSKSNLRIEHAKYITDYFESLTTFDEIHSDYDVKNLVASHYSNSNKSGIKNRLAAITLLNKSENKERWKAFRQIFDKIDKF